MLINFAHFWTILLLLFISTICFGAARDQQKGSLDQKVMFGGAVLFATGLLASIYIAFSQGT